MVTGRLPRMAAVHDEAWSETEIASPETYIALLKSQRSSGLRADVFTFAQKLPAVHPKYSYQMEWESVAAIRVSGFEAWWDGLPQGTRKNVRRSQKRGVVVEVRPWSDEIVRGLVELNNDSPVRQGRPNRHFGKSFDQVKRDYSSFLDRSDLICAYFGDELIGLLKLVYRGDVAAILQCLPKAAHLDKNPANALIAKAVEVCEKKHISYLTYGLFTYSTRRASPLLEFKIRNGFEELRVPRYYVPLCWRGSLCMKLGLHRGLVGMLPDSAIDVGIRAREKWQEFRGAKGRSIGAFRARIAPIEEGSKK